MKAEMITGAFNQYADAMEAQLARMADTIAVVRTELAAVAQERSVAPEDPRIAQMQAEVLTMRAQIDVLTRALEREPVTGPPGPAGPQGERGADGMTTREEVETLIEDRVQQRTADLHLRALADTYREVYRAGESYKRSETATWDGSLWLAMRDTQSKPGIDDSWRLITKRGRDAQTR